ncbi:MAG: YicC family protein [Ruminococcaceae bacterium]|nr:YicC family protein [Oscillospiraceae bacterium]
MLKSMTAFGRARAMTPSGDRDITAELRSVNSRYLDVSVRLPRMMSFLEEKIKVYLAERGISRGKIEVNINVNVVSEEGVEYVLDTAAARSYITALETLRDSFGLRDDISVMQVAANRDLFTVKKPEDDMERDWNDVKPVLAAAVDAFLDRRAREGKNLEEDIVKKCENIKALAAKIKVLSEGEITGYSAKLEQRIRQFLADFDTEAAEQRILTEAAIYADRAAIDEELVRLDSHFTAMADILASDEAAGRKLDFLLQEMNRETNTIGSKAGNAEIAHMVVDIKCELEKIREQIQNIE